MYRSGKWGISSFVIARAKPFRENLQDEPEAIRSIGRVDGLVLNGLTVNGLLRPPLADAQ